MKPSNKGRICRIDQAWHAALREEAEREQLAQSIASGQVEVVEVAITELPEADADDPEASGTSVVPFIHAGIVDRDDEGSPADFARASSDDDTPYTPIIPPAAPTPGESLVVPVSLLQTALLTAAHKDVRHYLNGVFVHAVDGDVRIVATDGHRLIVSRIDLDGTPVPEWAEAGVIIPAEELRQALPLLSRNGVLPSYGARHESGSVVIDYGINHPRVTLRAFNGFASFSLTPVDGKYPDYARVLASQGATLARNEGQALRATGIDTRYLKSVADIAGKLGAKAVHPFIGSDNEQAAFFTFDGAPDTVLIVMGMRSDGDHVSPSVVRMVGKEGVAASIAAFRAHLTRTVNALAAPDLPGPERETLEARRNLFKSKIASLVELTTPRLENKAA